MTNQLGQSLNFVSDVTFNSKTPGYEQVKFTIVHFTHGRRVKLRLLLADSLDKLRDITTQMEKIQDRLLLIRKPNSGDGAGEPDLVSLPVEQETMELRDLLKETQRYGDQIDTISMGEIDPIYLRFGLVAIKGLLINGQEPDADLLRELGPENLCNEIIGAIKKEAGLGEEVKQSLESPSTSGAVVDGKGSSTTAPTAGNEGTTGLATVQSITRN